HLDAAAAGVVDEQQADAGVLAQVAGRDVRRVAGEIDEADGLRIERADEAARSAAVLDVRLAVGAGGGEEGGVDLGEKVAEVGGHLDLEAAAALHPGVGGAR